MPARLSISYVDVARVRGVDVLPAADVEADMAEAVEEDDVPGLELVDRDRDAVVPHRIRRVRAARRPTCANAYMTRPEQSKPPGAAPAHT